MNNKFKIITPSYNNSEWVEYNVASILNQTYSNYEVLYIDDCSQDDTYEKVTNIINSRGIKNWTVIRNEVNKGATYNYLENATWFSKDDQDIIVHLDGDDWFYDDFVLEKLNDFYNKNDVWMTYGGFLAWNGESDDLIEPYPQSTKYPDFVHEHKKYREDLWRPSHLRTYRSFLFNAIDREDVKSLSENTYYWHASDLAIQYPCLEMCKKEQIGVVDFYTCIYNHTKANVVRTKERESTNNHKYEVEIRARKKYRRGINQGKLPQVNVIGDYRERNFMASKFSYIYNQSDGEFDVTLIQDTDCIRYVKGEITINTGKVVADIHEAPHLLSQNEVYDAVKQNSEMFDMILTFDKELLKLPNAVFRNGGYEVVLNKNIHKLEYPNLQDKSLIRIYENKPKHVSFITSNKTMTDGHRFRFDCAKRIGEINPYGVDIFGVGLREILGKIEGLRDYRFSIAMENGIHDNYFTEKILDCFLTGVIPIYRGCPNIHDFFNAEGFFIFNTYEELISILKGLDQNAYNSRLKYVHENFERAKQYAYDNDTFFEKYLEKLISQ